MTTIGSGSGGVAGPDAVLRARMYAPGDERAILRIFERVFGHRRSIEEWRWQFQQAPDGPAVILVLEHDRTPVGHLAYVGFAVSVDGRPARLARGCDMMVLPEFRGLGGTGSLLRFFLEHDHGFDMRMGFPTDQTVALLKRYGGGSLLGRLPSWVRLLERPGEFGTAGRMAAGTLVRLQGWLASPPSPRVEVQPLEELGPEVDELAEASMSFAPCIRIRDSAYLRWRWLEKPGSEWTILGAREEGQLRGFVVSGVEALPAGRRGRVVEVVAHDATVLHALLLESVRHLASAGCTRVDCDYHDPRHWTRRAFLRAGFVRRPGDLKVDCRALSSRVGTLPQRLESWYLTRGDTNLA